CMSHHIFAEVIRLGETSGDLTLAQLLERARHDLGSHDVILEFSRDVIHKLACSRCGAEEELFAAVGAVPFARGKCPVDGQMRAVITAHSYSGEEPFGDRRLDTIGLPLYDVFTARSQEREIAYLVGGDEKQVLGQLARGAVR